MSATTATNPVNPTSQPHPRATKSNPPKISEIADMAHRVLARIRFALNGFAPINQCLPPEVLSIIPSHLVRDRDRIVATHVCCYWRDAFLSTPSLWSRVSASNHRGKTEAYLKRSGDTPLDISVPPDASWSRGGRASLRLLGPLSNRCRTVSFSKDHRDTNTFAIIQKPCPRLLELDLDIPHGTTFRGIEDLSLFPSLKSLTLIGDIRHLRFSEPFNLRRLGVSCDGRGFRLAPLLELLARIPLLEEFEAIALDAVPTIAEADKPSPVVLKHLQRLVFRGIRSDFPRIFAPLITHPKDTKIILTHHLSYDALGLPPSDPSHHMFPPGMQLPTTSPPKFVRYRHVQDDDASEPRLCIDLISTDGQHTLVENRYSWADCSSLQMGPPFVSEEPDIQCLGFLRTFDLSFVERFCVEGCSPDPFLVGEAMGEMVNLGTLVVVNGYPHGLFLDLEVVEPPVVRCPLMRRLVVRQDVTMYMHWHMLLPVIEGRAAHGSPLERVTMTSSFNKLIEESEEYVQRLERTIQVTYDLGRNTFGWEWWEV